MLVNIRSCKYCKENHLCPYNDEIRDSFRRIRLDATAVINCKRVKPYYEIGSRIVVSLYDPDQHYAEEEDKHEIVSGVLVGYVFDRYGHARTYAVRIPKSYAPLLKGFYIEGEAAKQQFPEISLTGNEIIAFVKYLSIQRYE